MSITWDGISSEEFNMTLLSDIKFESVERDVEIIEIPGRDGAVVVDNKRNKNVPLTLEFQMKLTSEFMNIENQIKAVLSWLSNLYSFKSFSWVGESDYIFLAKVNAKATFDRTNQIYARLSIPISLHPYKFIRTTFDIPSPLTSGKSFTSQGTQKSSPIITLTGTGNITLTVNGDKFILKNITGGVVIDSENQVVTDLTKKHSQMDKVYSYPFPRLKMGSNTISWDNTDFTGTIIERWCELV
ncbi:phage tail protein [Lactococcus formosensis]|uniref:phage tail protein n=1 Tax=Lactococcus formosensis TaxID=1281486 RepID=UPI002434F178|nr:phage tail protein [Lactococcus formosensis]MDG6113744.1 phage tail protein [Lactococcus formosensis]MDG6122265.1 phage tail protein [Lactococcus formosensis]MDG6151871.1 phage tail protein [Lactococcus formosensis]MDG6174909.1 phage tail protein [Lactococcus formosensis]MDG6181227.1 phage tail protein [Lactococcus formosensis]